MFKKLNIKKRKNVWNIKQKHLETNENIVL